MVLVCNEQSAWGIIGSSGFIKITGIILLLLIAYVWYNTKDKIIKLGLTLVFLGGASNLGERFYYGCVTDYWKVVSWWPAFNLADVFISIGVLVIAVRYLLKVNR